MDSNMRIILDNATISHAADGTVIISPKKGGGGVTMALFIVTGLVAAGSIAMSVTGAVQLLRQKAEGNGGVVMFGVFVAVMFGGFAYYLYGRMRAGQEMKEISISPIVNVVRIGDRGIPFDDIADLATREGPIPMMEAMVAVEFGFTLTNGEMVEIGSKAMDAKSTDKIDRLKSETLTLLRHAIKKD